MEGPVELPTVTGYQPLNGAAQGGLSGASPAPHDPPRGFLGGVWRGARAIFFGSRIWPLLPFVPLAFVASAQSWPAGIVFVSSFLGLIPLVDRLEFITGQVALHTNPTLGGLLNATFSNAEEVIIVIVALRAGLLRLIQLSLLGSIFGNLLLGLGASFVAGGIYHREMTFNRHAALTNCSALALATMALMFPGLLSATEAELTPGLSILVLSRASAILLLIGYGCYLYFHLVTHKDLFEGTEEDDDDDGEEAELGFVTALVLLGAVTALLSFLCDFLVNSVEATSKDWSIPISGLCVIALPLVNNVAEHGAAVVFAVKGKLDVTISIAVGAAVQLVMLIFPLAVIGAWIADIPMDLNFHRFESCTLFISVLAVVLTLHEGDANWFKGTMLCLLYSIMGVAYFNHVEKYSP